MLCRADRRIYIICLGQSKLSLSPPVAAERGKFRVHRCNERPGELKPLVGRLLHTAAWWRTIRLGSYSFALWLPMATWNWETDAHAWHACTLLYTRWDLMRNPNCVMAVLHVWPLFRSVASFGYFGDLKCPRASAKGNYVEMDFFDTLRIF